MSLGNSLLDMLDVRQDEVLSSSEQSLDKVCPSHLAKEAEKVLALRGLVPEEELALSKLFLLCFGREDGLERVGVKAGVPGFCGDCHGGRREVLHLLQLEVEVFGLCCQFCHILSCATRVRADEVGDDLLAQVFAAIDVVEDALEVVEELEGRLAHEVEHTVGCVFGSYLQATAHVARDEFFGIFSVDAVDVLIARVVEQEVVAYA